MKISKTYSVIQSLCIALMILTFSVAVPFFCRPFYYAHIERYQLQDEANITQEEVREAYDAILDYCTGVTSAFSVGVLLWSDEGKSHFDDVRRLFLINLGIGAASLFVLLLSFCCRKKMKPYRFYGHGSGFWGAVSLMSAAVILGLFFSLDFNGAFILFHKLLFPGTTNWVLHWQTDPVILLLPEVFFRNCAILIVSTLILLCGAVILSDFFKKRKRLKLF